MKQMLISYFFVFLIITSAKSTEFPINTRTTSDQADPSVAVSAKGGFLVVWRSYGQDGSSNGIFAQLFDPNCAPEGEEFQVNTTTTGNQTRPAAAMDSAGNFVVTWHGPGINEQDEEDIFAQWFDPNGLPVGDEMQINSYTFDGQLYPDVAMNQDGKCIIVWESMNFPEEGNRTICGRLYDANGVTTGDEFIINEEPSKCRYPDVAMDPNGNFTVTWLVDKSSNSIMARIFNADGSAKTESFKVNTATFNSVTQPAIAMDAAGCFIVTWDGDPDLASLDDIHARMFDPNGIALGEQFVVNTALDKAQQNPQVAVSNRGEFVIVWENMTDPNEHNRDIFGQQFNCLCESVGDQLQLNTFVDADQRCPAVAIGPDGRFVTVWQSDEQDGSGFGIFGCMDFIIEPADPNDVIADGD